MYPGRAFGHLFGAAILAVLLTVFLMWVVYLIAHALFGMNELGSLLLLAYILWSIVTVACWMGSLHGEIRGWWTSEWD